MNIKLKFLFLSCFSTFVWSSDYLSHKRTYDEVVQTSTTQVYGIPTYDALFKYVLDDPNIRPSFFNAVLPDYHIISSERIDEHMNPVQEFQELRQLFHEKETTKMIKEINGKPVEVRVEEDPHPQATEFLNHMIKVFDDVKKAFPKFQYDGTMDLVCKIPNDEYILVEMQVIPYDYWDRRALAYVAAFYGRQMKKGDQWKSIKKVIGINILGGGKDRLQHWEDTINQYVRHYKMQEQLHQPSRYIDGIEIIQYSLMNAPQIIENQVLKDWITFFRDASRMTEAEVEQTIQTADVKEAFKRAKLLSLPEAVLEKYHFEDEQYSNYSQHTKKQVTQAVEKVTTEHEAEKLRLEQEHEAEKLRLEQEHEAEKEQIAQKAKREMALKMIRKGFDDESILDVSGLSQADLDGLKSQLFQSSL